MRTIAEDRSINRVGTGSEWGSAVSKHTPVGFLYLVTIKKSHASSSGRQAGRPLEINIGSRYFLVL